LIADARCGEYSARVEITATTLTVSGRSYTAHRCPAPVTDDQYQPDAATAALRTVLRGTLRWSIDRGVLTIGAGNGPQLQYGPQADAPTPSATPATVPPSATATASPVGAAVLVDRTWYLAEVEQRPASDSSYSSSLAVGVGGTPPTFRIGSDGQFLAGLGTCEAYQGRARVADGTFTIASRSRSAGTCPAEPDAGAGASDPLPTLMAQVLSGTVQWQVSGDALSLSHAGNAVVLHYSDLRPSATVSPRS
jgi:heat shock protein HslJ